MTGPGPPNCLPPPTRTSSGERGARDCVPGSQVGLNHACPSPQPQSAGPCRVQCPREAACLSLPLVLRHGPFGSSSASLGASCALRGVLCVSISPTASPASSSLALPPFPSLVFPGTCSVTLYVSSSFSISDSASLSPPPSPPLSLSLFPSLYPSLIVRSSLSTCGE